MWRFKKQPKLTEETKAMRHLFEAPLQKELQKHLSRLGHTDVFVDVGACFGTSCLLIDKGVCYAFEADPDAVLELEQNIKLNPKKKIIVVPKAVSNEEVGYEMHHKSRLGDTFLVKNSALNTPKTVTLDSYFQGCKNIKLIKVDAEGQDFNVLLGATKLLRKHRPVVVAEAWNRQIDTEITVLLNKLGYRIKHVGINIVGEYRQSNRRLEVTTLGSCPVGCNYCPQNIYQREYTDSQFLSLQVFKTALANVPKDVTVEFAGFSEPLLNPQCLEMVEYANAEGYRVIMDTTLTGLREDDLKRLAEIDFVAFSLHLPDNKGNTKIPIDSQTYKNVLASCLDSIRVDSFVCMNDNFVSNTRAGNCEGSNPKHFKGMFTCERLKNPRPVMLPNGDVVLCCMDYSLKHKLGNLFREPYESIVNSAEYQKVKANRFKLDGDVLCRKCVLAVSVHKYVARFILGKTKRLFV